MSDDLIIISAGQYGREAFAWATQAIAQGAPWRLKGFLDDRPSALQGLPYEAKILGDVGSYRIEEHDVFVGAIGDPRDKVRYYSPILARQGRFINVIHPLANLGYNVQLGTGIILAPFSSITCDARIGSSVAIGAMSNVGHDTVVGDWCQISSHCGINGNVTLGEGVFLGSHVCLAPGIRVGAWAYIGAGSVVLRDVQPGVKMLGNPAICVGRVCATFA